MKFLKEENGCYHFSDGGKVVKVAKNAVSDKFKQKYFKGGVVDVPAVTNPTMLKKPRSLEEKLRDQMDPNVSVPRVSQERGRFADKPEIKDPSLIDKIKADWENSDVSGDLKKSAEDYRGYYKGGIVKIDDPELEDYATREGLKDAEKAALMNAFVRENNRGKSNATSIQGARGPMQIMPETFENLKRQGKLSKFANIDNPSDNKLAAVKIMQEARQGALKDSNDPSMFSAYYHGGPNVVRGGKINPKAKDALGTRTTDYASTANQYMQPQQSFKSAAQNDVPFYERPANPNLAQSMNFDPQQPAIFPNTQYPAPQNNEDFGNMLPIASRQRQSDAYDAGLAQYAQQNYGANKGISAATEQSIIDNKNGVPGQTIGPEYNEEPQAPWRMAANQNKQLINQANQGQKQGSGVVPAGYQQNGAPGYSLQDMPGQLQEIYDAQSGAMQTQANSQEMQRQADVNYQDNLARQQQEMINRQNELIKRSNDQIDNFSKEYLENKIDPNRLFRNASTSRMFSGAIGLMLSGIGSALTGQPSQALMVIDRAIDRDIEAQKLQMGKGKTILDLQLQKYGNEKDAIQATRIMLGTQALAEMEKAKALAKKPEIQANLQMNQANLKLALVKNMLELNNKYLNYGATTGAFRLKANTPDYYRAIGNNPDLVEKMFVDDNQDVYFAKRKDSAEKVDQYMSSYDSTINALDDLSKFDTVSSKFPMTKERQLAKTSFQTALKNLMSGEAAKVGSTRLAELEREISEMMIQDPTKWNTVHLKTQLDALKEVLDVEKEDFLYRNLVGYRKKQTLANKAKSKGFVSGE